MITTVIYHLRLLYRILVKFQSDQFKLLKEANKEQVCPSEQHLFVMTANGISK